MDCFLEFDDVTRTFGEVRAVERVTLAVRRGEVFGLLGPSGCGKTTLLRMAAGFDRPTSGRIVLDGRDITALPPERRPVNTVFQNYALFPHLTVRENIAFGLRVARRPRAEIERETARMIALVQLEAHAGKMPAQLSGGQKQRVAIARALINQPQVLLLDEPLAALDLKLRQRMLGELNKIHQEVGTTFVFVTHDQGEAMSLCDRIAVMHHGRVEQLGTPHEIYTAPRTSFVASFIGDTNFIAGRVIATGKGGAVTLETDSLGRFDISAGVEVRRSRFSPPISHEAGEPEGRPTLPSTGDEVLVSVRPEKLRVTADAPDAEAAAGCLTLPCHVEEVVYLGATSRFAVRTSGGGRLWASCLHDGDRAARPVSKGAAAWLRFSPDDALILARPADVSPPNVS